LQKTGHDSEERRQKKQPEKNSKQNLTLSIHFALQGRQALGELRLQPTE
jgi:hypothetical protein